MNQINYISVNKNKQITTLFELKAIIKKYKSFIEQQKSHSNEKEKCFNNEKEIEILFSKISQGIILEIDTKKYELIKTISEYISKYTNENIFVLLKDIRFFTTDLINMFNCKFCAYGEKIGIDYHFIEFDENGKATGFKSEYEKFIDYVMIHEILHIISFNNKKRSMLEDGISEGFTDLLAHKISNNYKDKSKLYEFPMKVCEFLVEILGMDKLIDDYIKDIEKMPSLSHLFKINGLNYLDFSNTMNAIIDSKNDEKEKENYKFRCLSIITELKEKVCKNNPNLIIKIDLIYKKLFSEYLAENEYKFKKR